MQPLPAGQQQVPMTTIMIPAVAASQLQSASAQIQQAAQMAMGNCNQPQIMVFMIPYLANGQTNGHPAASTPQQLQQQPQYQHLNIQSPPQPSQQPPPQPSQLQQQQLQLQQQFQQLNIQLVPPGQQAPLPPPPPPPPVSLAMSVQQQHPHPHHHQQQQQQNQASSTGSQSPSGGGVLASVNKVNFLKRRMAQRSKSLCEDSWDNVVFDIGSFKLPAYERVAYKHPGFCRPVVIFGPLADVAREKLLRDYPEKYSYPSGFNQSKDHPKVIRLKGILEVIDQGKHALLDITPSAVEKLNAVNLAPIVIFMKTDSKSIIMEFRTRAAKSLEPNVKGEDFRRDSKSCRKLLEQSIKLEKTWSHVFTATLNLSTMGSEMWYRKLRETIENQQSANVWMGEKTEQRKSQHNNNHHHHNHHLPTHHNSQIIAHNSHSTSTLPHLGSGISSHSSSQSTLITKANLAASLTHQTSGSELSSISLQNSLQSSSVNGPTRGSAFQLYSDINQNNYYYYDVNKI